MTKVVTRTNGAARDFKAEARELRRTGKHIAASKAAALRLLAATGIYTLKGELQRQFR
jgi:hypothetical protein